MRFGIISDIHGNVIALNKALEEFEKRNIDKIIFCGDAIGIGPEPEKVVKKLIEYKDKIYGVRGNHEQYLLVAIPETVHDEKRPISEIEIEFHKWTHNQLSEISKKYLETLPIFQSIEIEGKKIYVTHYPYNQETGEYKDHIVNPSTSECVEMFSEIDADVFLFGHTHKAVVNRKDDRLYINPGSLGCPAGTNKALCGILNIEKEKMDYEELYLDYDLQKERKIIKELKYPNYEYMLESFFK